jgi:hypothetical protein
MEEELPQPQKKTKPRWVKIVFALIAALAVISGSYFFWAYWGNRNSREGTISRPENTGPISTAMRNLMKSRNIIRQTDMEMLLEAIELYKADHLGALPPGLTRGMQETQIGTALSGCDTSHADSCGTVDQCVDFSNSLKDIYLRIIPIDPLEATQEKTGYSIQVDADGLVIIKSCHAELGEEIIVSH